MPTKLSRAELAQLIDDVQERYQRGQDYSLQLETLQQQTQFPNLEVYLLTHDGATDHLVERLAIYEPIKPQRTPVEIIQLVRQIMRGAGSAAEIDEMLATVEANVSHPAVSDLIFWPPDRERTAEEIVAEAFRYQPIITPPPHDPDG